MQVCIKADMCMICYVNFYASIVILSQLNSQHKQGKMPIIAETQILFLITAWFRFLFNKVRHEPEQRDSEDREDNKQDKDSGHPKAVYQTSTDGGKSQLT